jgi:hypothetical protein
MAAVFAHDAWLTMVPDGDPSSGASAVRPDEAEQTHRLANG